MATSNESTSHVEEERLEHSHAGRYFWVWVALIALTGLTYWLSRFHLAHGWAVVVALGIASAKSALVALFFMHLWDQRGANRLVFVTSLVFVALLVGLTVADNATRFPLANPPEALGGWPKAGTPGGPPEAR
ncbi:MAG TPA: cytochrome C oxidase subunit IV family protein [Anaeromyxobacteraceae bacterium]|nr:cytochrome C oxidase subunit IV family protein [Anaeromyxobacteraceae bacterium]